MRIAVTSAAVPFIRGGAEMHNLNLVDALRRHGHVVDLITLPFQFSPSEAVLRNMRHWEEQNFNNLDVGPVDMMIATKFPAYYAAHDNTVVWLMHQHRAVYELWETPYGDCPGNPGSQQLRTQIIECDTRHLSRAKMIFANSERVAQRLKDYNGLDSRPIAHPPPKAEAHFQGDYLPYIFVPSRLEALKRQDLAIKALQHCNPHVRLVVSGRGGLEDAYRELVARFGLEDRVMFLGHVSEDELLSWFANSMAVFFGPHDEDYGYVTLEAMLSGKAVVTCSDSGGPLTFVRHGETGLVSEPTPEAIAACFDELWQSKKAARTMGMNGLSHYQSLDISWDTVVETLTGSEQVS